MAHSRPSSESRLDLKHIPKVVMAPGYSEKWEKEVVLNELETNTGDKEERPRFPQ